MLIDNPYINTQTLAIAQSIYIIMFDPTHCLIENSFVKSITRKNFTVWCQGFKNRITFDKKTGQVVGHYIKTILAVDPKNINLAINNLQLSNKQVQTIQTMDKIPVLLPSGEIVIRKSTIFQGERYIKYCKTRRRVVLLNGVYVVRSNHV